MFYLGKEEKNICLAHFIFRFSFWLTKLQKSLFLFYYFSFSSCPCCLANGKHRYRKSCNLFSFFVTSLTKTKNEKRNEPNNCNKIVRLGRNLANFWNFSVIFTIVFIFWQISNDTLRVTKFRGEKISFLKIGVLRISCFCVSVYYIEHELRLAMPKLLQSRSGPAEHFQIKWGTSHIKLWSI